ncbi:hypothetical protein HWC80_gp070 [Mycobacterium phage Indlulamithi]|uniref:Uncharacterized protein n=1 Tax=Mycobacterium phage Indlulamithi TaxID=2656582 RepID=A0A649VCS3_9CAUD|nr:hypothetical protein HWC80_gp070 [Mycobacterium phage Indlulamithi]QGJ90141.1 hypothetical protein PBI_INDLULAMITHI_104 [Mycobacterium phage Indlulamithi]
MMNTSTIKRQPTVAEVREAKAVRRVMICDEPYAVGQRRYDTAIRIRDVDAMSDEAIQKDIERIEQAQNKIVEVKCLSVKGIQWEIDR